MGSDTLVTDYLGDEAVVGVGTDADVFVTDMVDDVQVDVVKSTDSDQLAFTAAVFDLSLGGQFVLELDLTIFFSRNGEKDYLAVQFFFYFRVRQGNGGTNDSG